MLPFLIEGFRVQKWATCDGPVHVGELLACDAAVLP